MLGTEVYTILSNSSDLTAIVSDKIYPVVIDQNAAAPMVVFHTTTRPVYSGSGLVNDESEVRILAFSEGYDEAVLITKAVRNALELYRGEINGTVIKSVKLSSIDEDYDAQDDMFVHRLVFNVTHN